MTFEITREQFEATVQQYMAYLFPEEDPGYCGFCERRDELNESCAECPAFHECWCGVYVRWMDLEYREDDVEWEEEQCLLEMLELLHGYEKERGWVK